MSARELGKIVIKHWEGDVIFEIREAKYKVVNDRLGLQVLGGSLPPSHPMAVLGEPAMTIWFPCPGGLAALHGVTIKVPPYSDRAGKPEYSSFFLHSYHECHGTEVSISQDGSFRISATCEDVNYYDGRAKDNRIEVHGPELRSSDHVYDPYE